MALLYIVGITITYLDSGTAFVLHPLRNQHNYDGTTKDNYFLVFIILTGSLHKIWSETYIF